MRIAIDARELCGKPTGVGRYLFELLAQWAVGAERYRHELVLYAHETPIVPDGLRTGVRVVPGSGGTRWEQWDFARRLASDKPDVLFAPAYTAPMTTPCPVVLTVHDMSFFARPREFRWREGVRRRRITTWAARRARIILTVSEFSRREIAQHTGVPAANIRVIAHGIQMPIPAVSRAREPLILYVGSIFPRRHVDTLVSAFTEKVAAQVPDARLDVVGGDRLPPGSSHPNDWLRGLPSSVSDRITFRSWVDEETLRELYARASVFAFLSDYEGFGLTPLEALAAGVPPVVLDTSVAREVYGEAARFVSRDGALEGRPEGRRGQTPSRNLRTVENSVGDALVELLTNEGSRGALLRQAPAVLARYRWDRAASLTLAALVEAAGG